MDNGEVIPGLNDDWTFAGAKAMEWIAGLVMMLIVSELFFSSAGGAMPILISVWLGTTLTLSTLRRQFPDEQRGLRNFGMLKLGFPPPGIPTPAPLQPIWSGAPLRELPEKCVFRELELAQLFTEQSGSYEEDSELD